MAARASGIEIPLRIRPDSSVQRALRGVTNANRQASLQEIAQAKKAADAKIKEQQRAEREKKRSDDRMVRAVERQTQQEIRAGQKAADARVKAGERANQQEMRAGQQLARWRVQMQMGSLRIEERNAQARDRIAKRSVDAQLKEYRRQANEQKKIGEQIAKADREARTVTTGGVVAGVAASATVALSRANDYANSFGASSPEEKMQRVLALEKRARLLGDAGGLDAKGKEGLKAQAYAIATQTGRSPEEVMGGMEVAQSQFTSLGKFRPIMGDIAKASVISGSSVDTITKAVGVMARQYGIETEAEMKNLIGLMQDAADKGSIEYEQIASSTVPALGTLGRSANLKGIDGAAKALGLMQVMGQSDVGAAQASVLMENVVNKLNQGDVDNGEGGKSNTRRALYENFGVNVQDKTGALRPIQDIVRDLSAAGFSAPGAGGERFSSLADKEARTGLEVLVKQYEQDRPTFDALMSLSAESGTATIERRYADVMSGELGDAATFQSREMAKFAGSDEFNQLLTTTLGAAEGMTMLQAEFPLLTEKVKIFGAGLAATFATLGVGGFIAGLKGGATVTAAATGTPAVAAAGALALAPLAAVGVPLAVGMDDTLSGAGGLMTSDALNAVGIDTGIVGRRARDNRTPMSSDFEVTESRDAPASTMTPEALETVLKNAGVSGKLEVRVVVGSDGNPRVAGTKQSGDFNGVFTADNGGMLSRY